jgi:hypothetical protein
MDHVMLPHPLHLLVFACRMFGVFAAPSCVFDGCLISDESGIKVRVFFYVSCFAFKYNTTPPLHITRCHFTCTLHNTHAIITPIYNMRPAHYSTRDQTRGHSPLGVG